MVAVSMRRTCALLASSGPMLCAGTPMADDTLSLSESLYALSAAEVEPHRGTVATLDVLGKFEPVPGLTLSAGPGLTWGSSQYNETDFGVSDVQRALRVAALRGGFRLEPMAILARRPVPDFETVERRRLRRVR